MVFVPPFGGDVAAGAILRCRHEPRRPIPELNWNWPRGLLSETSAAKDTASKICGSYALYALDDPEVAFSFGSVRAVSIAAVALDWSVGHRWL